MHDGGAKLKVVVALYALFCHRLCDGLVLAAFKLSGKEIAEPALEERHHTSQEEEPHSPHRRPEANPRALHTSTEYVE